MWRNVNRLLPPPTSSMSYTVKPDKLVQLKLFEETDCLELFKFTNSNKLSTSNYFM